MKTRAAIGMAFLLCVAGMAFAQGWIGGGYGKRTTGYGTSSSTPVTAAWDTVTYLFVNSPNNFSTPGTHTNSQYDYWAGVADSLVNLQGLVPDFAWAEIDETSSNASAKVAFSSVSVWNRLEASTAAGADNIWDIGRASRRHVIFHIAFENYVPAGSQVISSKLHTKARWGGYTSYVDVSDSLVFSLISEPGYEDWYDADNRGLTDPWAPNHAYATWDYQVSALDVDGYPSSGQTAWPQPWDDVVDYWDLGDYSDWCGAPYYPSQTNDDEWNFDILNVTQAIVNGETNNGILWQYKDNLGAGNLLMFCNWQEIGAYYENDAFFVVQWLTKPYKSPMPEGSDVVFALSCYDGTREQLLAYDDLFQDFDEQFTVYVPGIQTINAKSYTAGAGHPSFPEGTQLRADVYDLATLHEHGHEIASHSFIQNGASRTTTTGHTGVLFWEAAGDSIDAEDGAGAWKDSLAYDVSREWMFELMEDSTGVDLRGDPRYARSFSPPSGHFGPYVVNFCFDAGYDYLRVGMMKQPNWEGVYDYYKDLKFRPADGDTFREGFPVNGPRGPRNVKLGGMAFETDFMVGDADATPSEAVVKRNFLRAIHQIRGQKRGVFSVDVHDTKTNFSYGAYDDRADTSEVRWWLEVLEDLNIPCVTDAELYDWYARTGTFIPTPSTYAQNDSFKFRADEKVWMIPDGIDSTIIRSMTQTEIVLLDLPVYAHFGWGIFQAELTGADYDFIAAHDVYIFPHQLLNTDRFIGIVDEVRSRNPNFIPLTYLWCYGAQQDWEGSSGLYLEMYNLYENNDWFAKNVNGDYILGAYDTYPVNPLAFEDGLADSLAVIFKKYTEAQDNWRPHIGVFADWFATPMSAWAYIDSLEYVDWNQNGTPRGTSGEEFDIEEAYNITMIEGFEAAFRAVIDDPTFLFVTNVSGDRHATIVLSDGGWDGSMYEIFQSYYPTDTSDNMDEALATDYWALNNTRVDPPIMFWQGGEHDAGPTSELLAPMSRAVSTYHLVSENNYELPVRLHLGPMISGPTWDDDTLSATFSSAAYGSITLRLVTELGVTSQTNLPWEGIAITADADTLRRFGGWPRWSKE